MLTQPLGLILGLRCGTDGATGLYRVEATELREIHCERPPDLHLAAWARRKAAFLASFPEYVVIVRVTPAAAPFLALLDEGALELPLPAGVSNAHRRHRPAPAAPRRERRNPRLARLRERMAEADAQLAAFTNTTDEGKHSGTRSHHTPKVRRPAHRTAMGIAWLAASASSARIAAHLRL